jgi:hypothetical protein
VTPADVVVLPGWRWMPGMRSHSILGSGFRVVSVDAIMDSAVISFEERPAHHCSRMANLDGCLPDPNDAATLGCLLALVREAWGDPSMGTNRWTDGGPKAWLVELPLPRGNAWGPTEWDALAAALAAAPGRAS